MAFRKGMCVSDCAVGGVDWSICFEWSRREDEDAVSTTII